jgi:hypothetical protein
LSLIKSKIMLSLLLIVFSVATTACSLDRSDPQTISDATLRSILAKDYPQLQELVGYGGSIPSRQAWNDASFIRDHTPDERIKARWLMGSISGYTLNEIVMEDYQGISIRPERLVHVRFVLAGKSYVATFPITLSGDKWSPGMNPSLGDFFIRFEARVE